MNLNEKVKQRYSGERGKAYHDTKRSIPEAAYDWVAELRAEKLIPYIGENDTILEYGVGTGWNLAGLRCKRRLGFDLAEHLQPVVESHGIEFVKDISAIMAASIDVVICHHVLEHTSNPPHVLEQILRVLRSGGKLLLFVPYEKERRYRRYDPNEPNHHLYSWNVQTLGNLIEDFGLRVLQGGIERFGYDRFCAVWAVRLHWGRWGFRFIRRALHLIRPAFEVYIVAQKQ